MSGLGRMSFHEANVIQFIKRDDVLYLELDGVLVGRNKLRVALKISSVSCVKVDGEFPDRPLMELNDGEVLSLDVNESGISIVIEWNDFPLGVSVTREYRISGGGVSVAEI
ncbi:MAG TPA: hypothetical protein VF271_01685 [Rhodanobacteraceae bacterium]